MTRSDRLVEDTSTGDETRAVPKPPPAVAAARSSLIALKRHRAPGDPAIAAAVEALRDARAEEYIKRLVSAAPPLSAATRERLAAILSPAVASVAAQRKAVPNRST